MKKYFLFIGQNATCGSPNRITGKMSTYGETYRFDSTATRNYFLDKRQPSINDQVIVAGGADAMRRFHLGSAVADFKEQLMALDIISMRDLN